MSPTSSSGPPTSNSDFQPSYNGTELVMLYDYKVSSKVLVDTYVSKGGGLNFQNRGSPINFEF